MRRHLTRSIGYYKKNDYHKKYDFVRMITLKCQGAIIKNTDMRSFQNRDFVLVCPTHKMARVHAMGNNCHNMCLACVHSAGS